MEILICIRLIIEAIYIYSITVIGICSPEIVVAGSRETGRIFPVADFGKPPRDVPLGRVSLLSAFVADTPEDYRRMVPVPVDHGYKVFFYPLVEKLRVSVLLLRHSPGVSQFIDDHETEMVAQVQQLRCRRIVGHTDSIAAHVAQHVQPAQPCIVVPDGAESSGIVVQADAFEEGLVAVQIETVRPEFYLADTED